MKGAHWEDIRKALGDEKPMSVTYIDESNETWFAVMNAGIYVWSDGTLYKDAVEAPTEVCDERRLFYHPQKSLYVELAVYEEEIGVLTCAVDNGFKRQFEFDVEDFSARCDHYTAVGFTPVGPWHLNPDQVVVREYRSATDKKVVRLDGNSVFVGSEETTCSDRSEAEYFVEESVGELLENGFEFVLIETMSARHQNPEEYAPPTAPEMAIWSEPKTAEDAVDQAMARLEELHRLFPKANAVLELLKHPEEDARAAEFANVEDILDLTWSDTISTEPAKNSFEYFRARYKTVTWAVLNCWNSASDYVNTFASDYGIGATCVVEIRDATALPPEWADDYGIPALIHLRTFSASMGFDVRFTSEAGEHPVVWFDHHEPEVLDEAPDPIEPFGFWLLNEVKSLTDELLPWLIRTQG